LIAWIDIIYPKNITNKGIFFMDNIFVRVYVLRKLVNKLNEFY